MPDPHKLRTLTRIGNQVLQDAHTGDMIFSVPELIAYITQVLTLDPGTVVVTGTPSGVGSARNRFLKPGETVVVEIEKLSRLSNLSSGSEMQLSLPGGPRVTRLGGISLCPAKPITGAKRPHSARWGRASPQRRAQRDPTARGEAEPTQCVIE